MAILVRKISRAKWPEELCSMQDLPADVLADLRTSGNELSLWRVESEENLETAMLALAASTQTTSIEKVPLVWIPENALTKLGIGIKQSQGDTVIDELVSLHRDACNLTYSSLGILAKTILTEMTQGKFKIFTMPQVRKSLVKAYRENRVNKARCKPNLLAAIQKEISKSLPSGE